MSQPAATAVQTIVRSKSPQMNQRDRVAQLAKTDFAAAFKLTGSIENVRERIQSLGWVARYAPADQIPRVIAAANKCAGTSREIRHERS